MQHLEASPNGSNHAFVTYVEGERLALEDPTAAIGRFVAAVEEALSVGANFVAGVAGVALASAQARTGAVEAAAGGYRRPARLLAHDGHGPQLWTTARNAASLLLGEGYTREAVLLLLCADATPEAAHVDPDIARHSGRSFVALDERRTSRRARRVP